ncbi:hypothetical protein LCGC14_1851200 [marine sediment metagenome]|uniref:Uncharacterized protein n=1 Tax=marine sediment metagenome TaxID=412755 RepID=A0A0F9J9M9_9ZZZZ
MDRCKSVVYAEFVKNRPFLHGKDYRTQDCSYWRIYRRGVVVDTRLKKVNAYKEVKRLRKIEATRG